MILDSQRIILKQLMYHHQQQKVTLYKIIIKINQKKLCQNPAQLLWLYLYQKITSSSFSNINEVRCLLCNLKIMYLYNSELNTHIYACVSSSIKQKTICEKIVHHLLLPIADVFLLHLIDNDDQ